LLSCIYAFLQDFKCGEAFSAGHVYVLQQN